MCRFSWRTFENKNNTAIFQPYTINVFFLSCTGSTALWYGVFVYDTLGFLHFATSFLSLLHLIISRGEKVLCKSHKRRKWKWLCCHFASIESKNFSNEQYQICKELNNIWKRKTAPTHQIECIRTVFHEQFCKHIIYIIIVVRHDLDTNNSTHLCLFKIK